MGFRGFVDWGFVAIQDHSTYDVLRDDPRFPTQIQRIRDDLARQWIAAEAWRRAPPAG
jgi:hypothetical protein